MPHRHQPQTVSETWAGISEGRVTAPPALSPCDYQGSVHPDAPRHLPQAALPGYPRFPADSAKNPLFPSESDCLYDLTGFVPISAVNRPGFPGECFICELRLPDHRFRWKHNKLFLLLPEEYGPAFPAIVDCYTSPPTLVWPVPLLHGFSSSYGVLPPLCKDH